MQYLTVKNWEKFQHYKHRNPPWIKLHVSLLDDADFEALPDASKMLAMFLWLLAARMGHDRIPDNAAWLRKHLPVNGPIDLTPLIDAGYVVRLQDASTMLATCLQDACSETETETETETESPALARQRVTAHFCERFGRRSYSLTPYRKKVLDEAIAIAGPDILCQAIDLYRDHPEFDFQRKRKDDGLCEYILRKGKCDARGVGIRERLDWIFRKAGKELCFD